MIVLVTGAAGQLGRDVVLQCSRLGWEVHGCTRKQLDVTNAAEVHRIVRAVQPDAIIHCAAYTAVDQAEAEAEQAFLVNAVAAQSLAEAARAVGAKLCYISTDYVFDGTKGAPYGTADVPRPQNVYGRTKLAGERYVQALCPKHFIVRTSWVFGLHGDNFVKTMLKLAQERQEIGVVADQVGSPTYAPHLAAFLAELVQTEEYGIHHAANSGHCSWFAFAEEIFRQADVSVRVKPLTTAEFPRPAARPPYSVLAPSVSLPPWQEALQQFLKIYIP